MTLLTCLDECRWTRQALAGAVLRHHCDRVLQATYQASEVARSVKAIAAICECSVHAYCVYCIELTTRAAHPAHTCHIISAAHSGIEAWWLAWCCPSKKT